MAKVVARAKSGKGIKALTSKKPKGSGSGLKKSAGKGTVARASKKVKLANYKF